MKNLIFIILVFACFGFTMPPTLTVTKPTPSDTKTVCASGCDYTTLTAADAAAQAGWLIQIKTGTYTFAQLDANGTSGNEIVWEAFGDGDVYLRGTSKRTYIFGSYVIFDGGPNKELIFDGSPYTGQIDSIPLYIVGSNYYVDGTQSTNITIWRCKIKSAGGGYGYGNLAGTTNIMIFSNSVKIYNCEISDSAGVAQYLRDGDDFYFKNNYVYHNYNGGVQTNPHEAATYCDNVYITGNAFNDNGLGGSAKGAINIMSETNTQYNTYVYNNIAWNNYAGIIKQNTASNMNVRFYNNTLYGNSLRGIWAKISTGTTTLRNNISWGNTQYDDTIHPDTIQSNNILNNGTDPLFESVTVPTSGNTRRAEPVEPFSMSIKPNRK